jgi:beta-xylosidase
LLELNTDVSAPLTGGLNRLIVSDTNNSILGYEGSHFYKINGKYYVFFIHSLPDRWRRVQACFVSDSLEGTFVGRNILDDDMGYCDQGIAQGGIVDTSDGKWYGILFQDRGAVGRIPILVPVTWQDDFPVFGENGHIPEQFEVTSTRPDYVYRPLVQSDDFKKSEEYGCFGFKSVWQFNHEPDMSLVHCNQTDGILKITTGKISDDLTQAKNTLTQRMLYPGCEGIITVDAEGLNEGDYAGICAFQGCYGMLALTKRGGNTYVVMRGQEQESEAVLIADNRLTLKVQADFAAMKDEAEFFYMIDNEWKKIGITQKLHFGLDHFTGCRIGLFVYSTLETGGYAEFMNFIYHSS